MAATKIQVETEADGSGVIVPAQSLQTGNSITVYAISRDDADIFVANVSATWSLQSKSGNIVDADLVADLSSKSAEFTGAGVGSAQIKAASGALTPIMSGTVTVTITASSRAMITLADLEARMGLESNSRIDSLLQAWINEFSDSIEDYTQRIFVSRIIEDIYDGDGTDTLLLRRMPMLKFANDGVSGHDRSEDVLYREDPSVDWHKVEDDARYILFDPQRPFKIVLYQEIFPWDIQNVKVNLVYGYNDVPREIQKVVYRMIQNEWNISGVGKDWLGKGSVSSGAGASFATSIKDLEPQFQAVLDKYRCFV